MRFGIWIPVYGGWLRAHGHDTEPSVEDCLDLARAAETLGYDLVYTSENFLNCIHLQAHDVLDAWTLSAAMAARTDRIRLVTALKPGFRPALVAAQMLSTVDRLSAGRVEVALVCGWWKAEFDQCTVTWRTHEEKYEDAAAYHEAMAQFWSPDRAPGVPRRPLAGREAVPVWIAGHSDAALSFAAGRADVLFLNGMDLAGIRRMRDRLDGMPRGRSVRLAMNAFVVLGESDEAAALARAALLARADAGRIAVYRRVQEEAGATGWAGLAEENLIDANGGFAAGLVGSPATLAARLAAFKAAGLDTLVCQFSDMRDGPRRFAKTVMPAFDRISHPIEEGAV